MKVLQPYNPLGRRNLGQSIVDALLKTSPELLPPEEPFIAAGIYAIYYSGNFDPYLPISRRNLDGQFNQPIYVGKAIPSGARIGGVGSESSPGQVLYKRLKEHSEAIKSALNLDVQDFSCRYLAVEDIWIPLGESLLIEMYSPLWNHPLSGFGNHPPGKGREQQMRSKWHEMHRGVEWAEKHPHYESGQYLSPEDASAALETEVRQHLASYDP